MEKALTCVIFVTPILEAVCYIESTRANATEHKEGS